MRPEYALRVCLNSRTFKKVQVDEHYKIKHGSEMNDALILRLVKSLDGETLEIERVTSAGWQVWVRDYAYLDGKTYRVVLCAHPEENHLGVINAFRRS